MNENSRPLSIAHLVFGLIFAGIATLWFIGNANDSDFEHQAVGLPVVLIGAGIIGLVAAVISRRQTVKQSATAPISTPTEDVDDTVVLTETKDES